MRIPFYPLVVGFFQVGSIFSQTEIHVHTGCSFTSAIEVKTVYTFEPSMEAESIVAEIMAFHSLPKNFVIKSSDVKNAIATTLDGQRYILYNTTFLQKFKADANTRWAAYSVIAHEIGHHLSGHDFAEKDPRKRKFMELEADRFAGGTLCLLGATLNEAQAGINALTSEDETESHPSKSARLAAIAAEWMIKFEWMKNNGMKSEVSEFDRDNDGLINDLDRCPDASGPKYLHGCPDQDADGVIDILDKCPTVYGSQDFEGCPRNQNASVDHCPGVGFFAFTDESGPYPVEDVGGQLSYLVKQRKIGAKISLGASFEKSAIGSSATWFAWSLSPGFRFAQKKSWKDFQAFAFAGIFGYGPINEPVGIRFELSVYLQIKKTGISIMSLIGDSIGLGAGIHYCL